MILASKVPRKLFLARQETKPQHRHARAPTKNYNARFVLPPENFRLLRLDIWVISYLLHHFGRVLHHPDLTRHPEVLCLQDLVSQPVQGHGGHLRYDLEHFLGMTMGKYLSSNFHLVTEGQRCTGPHVRLHPAPPVKRYAQGFPACPIFLFPVLA